MGEPSKRLHQRLAGRRASTEKRGKRRRPGEPLPGDIKGIETLINEGYDPVHAAYASLQQSTAHFAERVSQFPEVGEWTNAVAEAEDEYLPSGPPMSPLTGSFFWTWALYDLRIGKSSDTMASCQMGLNDLFRFNPHQMKAMQNLSRSRMGIYEHVGMAGRHVRLKELLTDEEFVCLCTAGYSGRRGELWYVRLLPPLEPEQAPYHITFTTPYILIEASKDDWLSYLQRTLAVRRHGESREALRWLMKHGPEPLYWHEFVFLAYCRHQSDAVFLAGIPDLKATLPHA